MTFDELEKTIAQYLLLADKGIVKLLCATVIANRILELDPVWLFVISNSSGGKSELLSALAFADGLHEQDDLTAKTFVSGAKAGGGKDTSLLYRLDPNTIMVFKDLTLLLDKDPRESAAIFSQLRLIYDGKLYKSFGTGEDIKVQIRMGLIAGVTSAIEDTNAKQASMGMRTIRYHMLQPDALTVTRLAMKNRKEKEMRVTMGEAFKEFLDNSVKLPEKLPLIADNTIEDIVLLAEMATAARSSIKRKEFSRDNPIERVDLREMPIRMAKQMRNLALAMMVINDGALTGLDHRILYSIAIDSIPSARKDVMFAATSHGQVTIDGLAVTSGLSPESVRLHVDDLVAHKIMIKSIGMGNKLVYELRNDYRHLISKFENIPLTNDILDDGAGEPPILDQPYFTAQDEQQISLM